MPYLGAGPRLDANPRDRPCADSRRTRRGRARDCEAVTVDKGSAVRETVRQVVGVEDSPKPPPLRITLTLPAIQRSREVWLLVAGEEKAEAVAEAIHGADPVDIPAAGAIGREHTIWFLDKSAASKLLD